jgi:type III restriction enzyme
MAKETSLTLAKEITDIVNEAWSSGEYLEHVSETSRLLLKYWFAEDRQILREVNFHAGQRQAILNIIYLHEVLKLPNIREVYHAIHPELLLLTGNLEKVQSDRWDMQKYAVKMATGTGKTWVLQALLIWQYLNAKYEEEKSGLYTKNFLLIAPGLIVYERLIDALRGKEVQKGDRQFQTSDIYRFQELFLPEEYRQTVFQFLQNAVKTKEEIGRGVSGEGLIAITNWHAFLSKEDEEYLEEEMYAGEDIDTQALVKDLLPTRPGKSQGNDLNVLDGSLSSGELLEFFKNIPDLCIFNDEAHRVREESKWQIGLDYISSSRETLIQIDFSATPYDQSRKIKDFFPHIIVDFDLKTAISKGLVKTIVLDERKEIATLPLDFKAERDEENNVIGLSEGQRVMLRAGLAKLDILQKHFVELAPNHDKYPKMFVMCEDTAVVGKVMEFLTTQEGLSQDDVLEIHSNKKGEVTPDEWMDLKQKLFSIDKRSTPRVIISVLMLREGFDVNNVCVIVPLRTTESKILLEQVIGRGLRLMWREPEFEELKNENRKRLLEQKREPQNYFDMLSIIEHPKFKEFYKDLIEDGSVMEETRDDDDLDQGSIISDMITVELKPNYTEYDIGIPYVIRESEEIITPKTMSLNDLTSYTIPLESLKRLIPQNDNFISEEITKSTRFGDYAVHGGIFSATSYNDYLGRLVMRIQSLLNNKIESRRGSSKEKFPFMQIQGHQLASLADTYIKEKLFRSNFNPFIDDNWRVLLIAEVSEHIAKELSKYIILLHQVEITEDAEVGYRYFSEISELRMRESYSLPVSKSIYDRVRYPSNKGNLEKAFIEYADSQGSVDAFIKIDEYKHTFARFYYIRDDGTFSYYSPDFVLRCGSDMYIVETKSEEQTSHPNVQRKQKASLDWISQINSLPEAKRNNQTWHYVLLGEETFYSWRNLGANIQEMLDFAKLRERKNTFV